MDNIDHDPTATSAQGSFHRMCISLLLHADNENRGTEQRSVNSISRPDKKVAKLPDSYTIAPAVTVTKRQHPVPEVCGPKKPTFGLTSEAVVQEND